MRPRFLQFFRRLAFNWWPCYRGTGGRVTSIAPDCSRARVKVPLSWRTRNYVGTIFGGSLYGAVDPIYMFLLIQRLGPDYVVWDKSAAIRFRRPGRARLFADFVVDDAEVGAIRQALAFQEKVDRTYVVELKDAAGEVHAVVEKVVQVRRTSESPKS